MIASAELIKKAAEEELRSANENHPLFASMHEAYAVAKEEFEEAEEAMEDCKTYMQIMWENIKKDDEITTEVCSYQIESAALAAAAELCQLAAMMQKTRQSLAKRRENG